MDVHLTLTKKQTKEVKAYPEIYKFISSKATFDFLDLHEYVFYPISFRVVRFVLPGGTYETVITTKRRESITQEIFARMLMYNFAEMMTSHVVISQMDKRHPYQVNFTVAVHVCRHFLRSRDDEPPPDVEALIRKNILPIRPIRPRQQNMRKIREISR
ncbi:hypothetical protein [Paenibacillus monticola]|uniref:Uncharacterized protein n=1 Tax=Paenibacillus monticola TaxID=2666075 RepID=A0A7X2H3V4_9BACL|nr:hypothetical protein [Paenibacillus monticola]MRN53067.1 hypothetical protein [Paenibacillus monticola]